MRKTYSVISCLILFIILFTACEKRTSVANYEVIPLPQNIEPNTGEAFILNGSTTIIYPQGNEKLRRTAEFLSEYLQISTGIKLSISEEDKSDNIISLQSDYNNDNKEAYNLNVDEQRIVINGSSEAGTFYGVQTLRKSIPAYSDGHTISFPQVNIVDYPRFGYRGMMLDVGRHYFPVEFIKEYIDILALHNLNYFHWHLTEDQGWRIEIKKYPKLTEIGSQRKETAVGKNAGFDGKPYGGFYTQEQAKEIVAYAKERFITVVPEIDLPGHMLSALASYPELGCTGGPYEVGTKWGVEDDVLCVGNENTFKFLENVFSELLVIFPSEYIHVGGDECPKVRWKSCPKCQAKIKELGLKADKDHSEEDRLQSYCINRIEKFLNDKGRKIIGWDEILEGGLAPNATVMSWRGMDGGIAAAKQKHDVIMTPNSHLYFDHYQTRNIADVPLAIGGYLPLEKVYNLNPVPEELTNDEKKYIIGVQANLWTEYIPDSEHAEYMLMPRIDALSEVQWVMPEKKDYNLFLSRLPNMLKLYDKLGYNYAKDVFDIRAELKSNVDKGVVEVMLSTFDNAAIYYTLDGKKPTDKSEKYNVPIEIADTKTLNAIAIRPDGESSVYTENFNFSKATLKPITLKDQPSKTYTFGGASALVDGLNGGGGYADGNWIGFLGEYVDAIIDLKESTDISSVKVGTFVSVNDWIFGATGLTVSVSDDGKTFKQVAKNSYFEAPSTQPIGRVNVEAKFTSVKTRYVKIEIAKTKKIPDWHQGKGSVPYLFIDEIQIN